ncbi:hypothetical protein BJ742DRAFT_140294 [Cladochytrium replicatum]|nr:hypothetical protein BJ742DRAFT_140294 [Cladochytrium replicatum]
MNPPQTSAHSVSNHNPQLRSFKGGHRLHEKISDPNPDALQPTSRSCALEHEIPPITSHFARRFEISQSPAHARNISGAARPSTSSSLKVSPASTRRSRSPSTMGIPVSEFKSFRSSQREKSTGKSNSKHSNESIRPSRTIVLLDEVGNGRERSSNRKVDEVLQRQKDKGDERCKRTVKLIRPTLEETKPAKRRRQNSDEHLRGGTRKSRSPILPSRTKVIPNEKKRAKESSKNVNVKSSLSDQLTGGSLKPGEFYNKPELQSAREPPVNIFAIPVPKSKASNSEHNGVSSVAARTIAIPEKVPNRSKLTRAIVRVGTNASPKYSPPKEPIEASRNG